MKTLAHRNIPITIVGGGIHGVSIALRLLREMPTAAKQLAIVDRHPQPLTQWRDKTKHQGMTFLRSPAVHHISLDALGIVEYAERHNRTSELAPPYAQPSTQLFWDFCNAALAELTQHQVYYQFEVAKLRWDKGAGPFPFRLISTNKEGFRSRCVILAIGADDCTYVPPAFTKWQRQFRDRVIHASQFSVLAVEETPPAKIVIVGGGLTAGTLAKSLSERGHRVTLIARKRLKVEQFDFPPVWLGPKALTEFASETDFRQRYDIIQQNRGEGSITPDIMDALTNAPNIDLYPETCIRNIVSVDRKRQAQHLQVETTQGVIRGVSYVILATGYQFNLRRYSFLKELITQHQIPLVRGLPHLDADLQLHPIQNLFCSGTIAQLQIGPASGNIAGANLAYERLREKLLSYL
ncbi:lysine N(6)-hydroxylase/L-ornithine N(5)-oxygenase family protein [Candidatus Poribacteria bacterium]|nr:lysine N(6)-hydroxylase/L-ornithine N(5)-oxygenase family protein [Candidatus Poribacteria bacterium]MYG06424.1 lysine N(6)-hydroxylase/L-ornithine N(5)-oxygenase family protein [Candidatus Poribacteria bacterium]MYK20877.1 lysine N(6)-hydroxylase/L-ornithine N(5)-oxygenase family protein [Candidatus Poribacteria bacterium]